MSILVTLWMLPCYVRRKSKNHGENQLREVDDLLRMIPDLSRMRCPICGEIIDDEVWVDYPKYKETINGKPFRFSFIALTPGFKSNPNKD